MTNVYRTPLILTTQGSISTTNLYYSVGNGGIFGQSSLLNNATIMQRSGFLDKLRIYVSANSSAVTTVVTVYKNGSPTAMTLNIGAGLTGLFEDTANFISYSPGDSIAIFIDKNGDTSTITMQWIGVDNLCTNAYNIHSVVGVPAFSTASTVSYIRPAGVSTQASTLTDQYQIAFPYAATVKNFQIYVSANARTTTTTYEIYKNGASTGIIISVGASSSGAFSDLVNTASFAAGDKITIVRTTGTGSGSITTPVMTWESETSVAGATVVMIGDGGIGGGNGNTNGYMNGGSNGTASTTLLNRQVKLYGSGTISNFRQNVRANTRSVAYNIFAYYNGTTGNISVTFPANTASEQTSAGTDSFVSGDLLSLRLSGSSGTGSATIGYTSYLMTTNSEPDPTGGSGVKQYATWWG